MNLQFTEEQKMMRKMVRDFAKQKLLHLLRGWKRANFHEYFTKNG